MVGQLRNHDDRGSIISCCPFPSQNIVENCFGAYDWQSKEENTRQYGQPLPPVYNLDQVAAMEWIYVFSSFLLGV